MFNLIIEEAYTPAESPVIIQDKRVGDNKYKLVFKTVLQEADVPNQNKRIYPKSVLEKVVQQLQPKAKNRELLSELDHPWVNTKDQDILKRRAAQIRLSEVCCLIRDIQFDGKYVIAECETLTNQKGLDLYGLIKDGVNIGFSLRAFGPVMPGPDGTIIVGDDIKAITYDVVSNPSHSNARILEFLNEDINLFKLDNNELLIENTTDIENKTQKKQHIYLPIGAVINDLNEDDISALKNMDNIDVQSFSITIDPENNKAIICNNNQCITKSLDDLAKVIIGRGRYAKLTGTGIDDIGNGCEFYPLVGFGRAVKMSINSSNYKPFLNPITDISLLQPTKNINDIIDIDDDDDEDDIPVNIQLNNYIEKSFENDLDLLESLLTDDNDDKFDKLFESIYDIAARKNNTSKDILFLEDYFDFEDIDNDNNEEKDKINIINETTNIDDYIDDENFEYGTTNIDDLEFLLDYFLNETTTYLDNIENIVLSNYNKSFNDIIQELNSIPSILEDLYLEDQKYNENSIITEEDNITEQELDILLNHLLKEYYNELKESINIPSNNIFDTIFFEHIYYDFK